MHQQVPYNPEQFIPEFDVNDADYQEELMFNEEARRAREQEL